jgi:hypothetical protein
MQAAHCFAHLRDGIAGQVHIRTLEGLQAITPAAFDPISETRSQSDHGREKWRKQISQI